MRTINCKQVLSGFDGKALKVGEHELTVGMAVSVVLGGQVSNPTLGFILGKKFANDETVDLKAEDIVFIKRELNDSKHWMAIVTGQILSILEGTDEKKG